MTNSHDTTPAPHAARGALAARLVACLGLLLGAALLTGCATVANPDPRDPLESYNRSMTSFNEQVDAMVLKPVATAYQEITPAPVRTGVAGPASVAESVSSINRYLQVGTSAAPATPVSTATQTMPAARPASRSWRLSPTIATRDGDSPVARQKAKSGPGAGLAP